MRVETYVLFPLQSEYSPFGISEGGTTGANIAAGGPIGRHEIAPESDGGLVYIEYVGIAAETRAGSSTRSTDVVDNVVHDADAGRAGVGRSEGASGSAARRLGEGGREIGGVVAEDQVAAGAAAPRSGIGICSIQLVDAIALDGDGAPFPIRPTSRTPS